MVSITLLNIGLTYSYNSRGRLQLCRKILTCSGGKPGFVEAYIITVGQETNVSSSHKVKPSTR